jgi:pilus assembly protein CpaF
MVEFLKACVQVKLNIVVSGGTGSGKTTLLNVLSGFIPEGERIITIEDAAELQLRQTHVLSLESRPANIEGKGRITIRDLVANALRMRPDRIIVGECRRDEALDMLQAMNTGHEGSMTTIHSNSPRDTLRRLETLVAMGELQIPLKAIREQICSAIHLIVHQERLVDGSRKITSITEVLGMEGGEVINTQQLFVFEQTGLESGRVMGRLRPTGARPRFTDQFELANIHLHPSILGAGRR